MRMQSGIIPIYRGKVVLVRKKGQTAWTWPKGGMEGLSPQKNALKEAWEEAGIKAKVLHKLGAYVYFKRTQKQKVIMFSAQVTHLSMAWPESETRVRRLFDLDQLPALLDIEPSTFFKRVRGKIL